MVEGAERYYLSTVAAGLEEYYTGSGEAPGTWIGRGGARLGLVGVVAPSDLSAVLSGSSPAGEVLTRRAKGSRRVAGLDLTFSAPKSVSLLYGLADPEVSATVRDAHAGAVADALGYLEDHALRVRRRAGGTEHMGAEGLVAASFVHRTSRAGDPQLHSHVLVANLAHGDDGSWSAPDARLLYHHAKTAGFLYQASLRSRLVDSLGVRFGPVKSGAAELDGVPTTVLRAFSQRRREIETHLETQGGRSLRARELAALSTREPKRPGEVENGPPAGLYDRWRARSDDLGFDTEAVASLLGRHAGVELDTGLADALCGRLLGPEGLTAQRSTFERRDVVRALAEACPDGARRKALEAAADRLLASGEVRSLGATGPGGERKHTTEELLSLERRLVDTALERRDEEVAVVAEDRVRYALSGVPELSSEQRAMVRALATSGAGVEIVVGKAGAGKTVALAAARRAWESAGHRVLGTSLAARAAKGLQEGAGIESTTLARLLGGIETGAVALERTDVVVCDEAGMVGTRALARLLGAAESAGAKVVLVGDPRQLPEIEAGGAFGALGRALGAVELEENRRQQEAWERAALDELRDGRVVAGLEVLAERGRVVVAPDMGAARGLVVKRWAKAVAEGEDAVMLAVNRRDVAALNETARRVLSDEGLLGAEVATFGERPVAVGERVVCTRNDRSLGVVNGTRGVVVAADRRGVLLDTQDGPRWLPAPYAETHLDYGYALTVHKAQGTTVDTAVVLATDSLTREAGYVALSRARRETLLVVPEAGPDDDEVLGRPSAPAPRPLDRVAQRLSVSRAKSLALAELESERSADGPPARPALARQDPGGRHGGRPVRAQGGRSGHDVEDDVERSSRRVETDDLGDEAALERSSAAERGVRRSPPYFGIEL